MSDMTPGQFLTALAGGGSINICSIVPDGPLEGHIIRLDRHAANLEDWAKAKNQNAGLYYSLNEPLPSLVGNKDKQKLGETDVASIRGIVLDIDPRDDEEAKPGGLERERARIRALAEQALSPDSPAPATFCVDSGGGFQIGWMFPEPIPATPENRDAVKAQAYGLGLALGGDATFSIDHLFRLPGTINRPNAKKRGLGRSEAPASVIALDSSRRYTLEDLARIAPPATPKAKVDAKLPEIDYGMVLDVAECGDAALPAHLLTYQAMLRQWSRFEPVMGRPDRSRRDIALTSECIRLGMTNPTEIACVVFSVAPEKLLEEEDNNRGERYARRMLADRLAKVQSPSALFEAPGEDGEPQKPRARIQLLTDEQLQTMPDPKWLIGRHIPETGFGILFGDPGTYKSFLALDMGLSIAAGFKDWYGDQIAEDAGAVLYIAGEGAGAFKLRIQAWKKQNWVADEMMPADRFRVVTASLNFMRHEDIAELLAVVEASGLKRMALIIIDTVSRAIPGADENKQQDMSIFVKACDTLRDRTGAFILGIHHAAKSGDMRGSSVIPGGGDAIFRVERKKGQNYVRLTCTKQKDAPDQWHDTYRLNLVGLDGNVSSLAPVRVEEQEAEEAICTEEIKQQIFAAVERDAQAGNHWSMAPRAVADGRKYAVKEIATGWKVGEDVAAQWLDMWLTGPDPELRVETVDSKNKRKGLIVLDTPIMDSVFS